MYAEKMTVQQIISRWPSRTEFADDIGERATLVAVWVHRGSIPAERDVAIVEAAQARRIVLTYEDLARMRAG